MRHGTFGGALLFAAVTALSGCTVPVEGTATADPQARCTPAPVAGPAAAGPAVPGETYADATGRFAVVPPAGWTVDTSGAQGTTVAFVDPRPTPSPAGEFSTNINVLVVPAGADLADTVVGARRELLGLDGYCSTADEPVVLGGGTPAHVLGGTFSDPASGFELRNLQVFAVEQDRTVVVTGTALAADWDAHAATIDAALRSLTVAT